MDFNSIKDQVSNLTLYDLKAGVRKVQNAVMNYTEMEAKVREATNNEPWGASSTLMQEIANGTHSYQLLNEIMPMIYKRFTDKTAEEWRQIYKALQLLEFLIKNGSERVIDDARSHLSLLRMLRQFHYIDPNGKDQGVNVRNRAQELAKLLNDVDAIRAERRKARSNRNKFGGVEGGAGLGGGFSSGGGSRYGGFGSEDAGYGGYSGGVYGDGGGFGGNTGGFQDSARRGDRFEEYDEYDEGAVAAPGRRKADSVSSPTSSSVRRENRKAEPAKKKEPEPDLFSIGDDDPAPTSTSNGKKPANNGLDMSFQSPAAADEDDFDDFQSATPSTTAAPKPNPLSSIQPPTSTATTTSSTQFAAPKPVSGSQAPNLNDLVGFSSMSPAPSTGTGISTPVSSNAFASPPLQQQQSKPFTMQPQQKPSGYQPAGPNYFTSVPVPSSTTPTSNASNKPGLSSMPSFSSASKSSSKPLTGGDAFSSLWSNASAGAGIQKTGAPTNSGPNLASMAKEKASAGIWGSTGTSAQTQQQQHQRPGASGQGQQKSGGGLDDLLG